MPYIKKEDRKKFDIILKNIPEFSTKGELEYCIYYLMNKYMKTKEVNYTNLHDVTYSAIHCGDEFRRRHLDKRENTARVKNGDIT